SIDPANPSTCKVTPSAAEFAALRALYGASSASTQVVSAASSAPARSTTGIATAATGRMLGTPSFARDGQALAVFGGGSVAELEGAARAPGAPAVWAQGARGTFHALLIGGPPFVNADFTRTFANGFITATSVTLSR